MLTPLAAEHEVARAFRARLRSGRRELGVHLGLRRDCGSTFARSGRRKPWPSDKLTRFVFEGAIRNFPSPDVEKDNVNYLAGVREIGVRSEYTDGRDMPRLLIRSVEFEGPFYETWPPPSHQNIFVDSARKDDLPAYARKIIRTFATRAYRRPITAAEESALMAVFQQVIWPRRQLPGEREGRAASRVDFAAVPVPDRETASTPEPEPLDEYELASKLSYFLWNGPPDRKTLQLAASGTLAETAGC